MTRGYAAGIMDGEGSFSIQVRIVDRKDRKSVLFNPRVTVHIKYGNEILDEFASQYGGKVYSTRPGFRMWVLNDKKLLRDFCEYVLPELKIKHSICCRFLEALAHFPTSRRAHSRGERSWSIDATLNVAEIALSLNPERARKDKHDISYLEELKAVYAGDPAAKNARAVGGPKKGSKRVKDAAGKWHWED